MRSPPEKYKIDSKRMRVNVVTQKGEIRFANKCKRLLNICDEIGTKGDKKHTKREAKSRLNHKNYLVHKEENILSNGIKAIYNILNNRDKVTMEHFYHIRCDPDLDKYFCSMRRIPCSCTGCVEKLSKRWLPNLDKTLQPRYVIETETCRYYSILCGYNKWYISKFTLTKETTNPDQMKIKGDLVLHSMTWEAADDIEYNIIGTFQNNYSNTPGYYIVQWTDNSYTLQGKYTCHVFDPPVIQMLVT